MRSWKRFCWVVEAILSGGVVAPGFAVDLPQFLLQRDHDFRHGQATIAPRSGHDRGLIVIMGIRQSPSGPMEAIPGRKFRDRGSIALRSRFDRTTIMEFFHESSGPSDGALGYSTVQSRSSGICC